MKKVLLIILVMLAFSCQEEDNFPKFEVITYYDWDMSSEFTRTIENPVDADQITDYHSEIYMDYNETNFDVIKLDSFNVVLNKPNGSITFIGDSIQIMIEEMGIFNSTRFDSIPQKRGYLTIKYD